MRSSPGRLPAPSRLRFSLLCGYALILLTSLVLAEAAPLVPGLAQHFGLDSVQSAALLALPSVTVMLGSIPVGRVADRVGAHRMTAVAAALIAGSCAAQSVASLPAIVAGRLAFGAAYAIVWTAALSWMGELQRQRPGRGGHLGATVTSAAIGSAVGPALSGVLAGVGGAQLPFMVTGVLAAGVLTALVACLRGVRSAGERGGRPASPAAPADPDPGGGDRERRPQLVRAATGALAMSGAVGGVVQLLAPVQLHALGVGSARIGVTLSAAALVYIATSALVVRAGPWAITLAVNAVATVLLAASVLPAATGIGILWAACVPFVSAVPRATIGTIAYPLAALGVGADARRQSGVFGAVNAAWAAAMMAAPVLAGLVTERAGPRAAYLCTMAVVAVVAGWLVLTRRRHAPARRPVVPAPPLP